MKSKSITAGQVFALVASMIVVLFSPVSLCAQESRGTITGKVMDVNKAAIPGVSVKITNVAQGISVSLQTNDDGFFQATYLLPGTYRIDVEGTGFKKYVRDGVVLQVNDILALDIPLEIGATEEIVTVTADAPALETSTGSMGQVVDERRVSELPIPHGQPFALMALSSGVAFTRDQRLDRPFEPTHGVGYSVDGTRANRSDITIDGVPATATANAGEITASFVPPADIVQEFKVQTATFDASQGNTEGGVTNLSIKSGTNDFHGTALWVKLAPKLFANDFFANANGIPLADFTYDRWGGTFSGPVRLPKIYNGRNRTFFLWGYEAIDEARPRNNGTPTVPTVKMRSGDFSELLDPRLNPQNLAVHPYQIFNPFTRVRLPDGRIQAEPFPGNIIPQNLINPIARAFVQQYLPNPLTAGSLNGQNNFQNPSLKENNKYWSHTVRIDHVLSDKQRIYVRGSAYNRDSNANNYFGNLATGGIEFYESRNVVFDHVYTFNPTTVMNTRYGYNRFVRLTDANRENHGFDLTTLGFPASYNNSIPENIRRFPRFDITGYQGTAVGGENRPMDTHSFNATVNKALNVHSLKFGMEFRAYRENASFIGNAQTGQFVFDSTWTRGPFNNSPSSPGSLGQSFAAFLLGLPSPSSFVARIANYAEQSTTWGFFAHDDWRFNNRLTLNLGLRYEVEGALTERFNRSVRDFDFDYVQPIEAQARANYARNPTMEVPVAQFNLRGGLRFAGVDGQPRALYETPKTNFMPRFGFAYKLTDKTVMRGGYGIFFGFLGQRRGDVIQTGFSSNTFFVPTLNNETFIATLSNPFPNGIQEPVGAALGPQTFLGQSVTFFNPDPQTPYMQRWQLGFQHELPGGMVAEASYVGNRGTHIEVTRNLNATPLQHLSRSPVRDQARINYLSALVPNPFFGLLPANSTLGSSSTIARERLLRPFPQFDTVTTTTNEGYSWYHSMQLRLDKRFSRGYTVGVSYTFSKFMEAVELLNAADPRPIEVIAAGDRPHRVSVSGIYELPFGKGRSFLSETNPIVSKIISGWQVTGIYAFQSGPPLEFGNIIFTGNLRDIPIPESQMTIQRRFNTDAGFVRAANAQLASNVRTFPLRFGFIRGDNVNNFDLSLIKNTQITERVRLQLRAEFLNAFNHPLFPNPVTDPTSANFGSISGASNQANYPRRTQLHVKVIF